MFPDHDLRDINADWLDKSKGNVGTEHNILGDEYTDDSDTDDQNRDTYTVVQIQWRERKKVVEYVNPQTGQRDEMQKERFDEIIKRVPLNVPSRVVTKQVWFQAFLGKDEILKENQPDPKGSTFHCITGHWDRKEKRFYGLLRNMKDPQKFANKWLSQTLHIINSNAKGGVIAETGAVDDVREFEESWAASDGVSWVKPGKGDSIKE